LVLHGPTSTVTTYSRTVDSDIDASEYTLCRNAASNIIWVSHSDIHSQQGILTRNLLAYLSYHKRECFFQEVVITTYRQQHNSTTIDVLNDAAAGVFICDFNAGKSRPSSGELEPLYLLTLKFN